jgi:voltage-dependent calcium channel
MDGTEHSAARSSTSSAIELVVTSASIGPGSPSLLPSTASSSSFARRRLSWGRVNPGQDPLRFDLPPMNDPGPSSRPDYPPQPLSPFAIDDDPFATDHSDPFRPSTTSDCYGTNNFAYSSNPRAGNSTTSLISSRRQSSTSTFDDAAHLTANIPVEPTDETSWQTDSEHVAAATPRTRHRTQRYAMGLSHMENPGAAIERISRSLRRVSLRVVNFAGVSLDERIRLADDDPATADNNERALGDDDELDELDEPPLDLSNVLRLRGRTLGFFGPTSRVRLAMYDALIFPCVFSFSPSRVCLTYLIDGQSLPFFVRFFFMPFC